MSQPQVVSLLLALAPYLVPPLVAVLSVLVKNAFSKLPANQRDLIKQVAQTAVVATEQTASQALNGPGKKQLAVDFVETELSHWGIKAPSGLVSTLIEEAVAALPHTQTVVLSNPQTPIKKGV